MKCVRRTYPVNHLVRYINIRGRKCFRPPFRSDTLIGDFFLPASLVRDPIHEIHHSILAYGQKRATALM